MGFVIFIMYPRIKCNCCFKIMPGNRTYKEYCSAKCMRLHTGIHAKILTKIECKECNIIFLPTRSHQIFCSKECRISDIKKSKAENIKAFSIFNRDGFTCIYCGKSSIEDKIKLAIDHVKPISKGGLTNLKNLITSCNECNSCKGDVLLNSEIEKRILSVINIRNNNISFINLSDILKEITILMVADKQRIKIPLYNLPDTFFDDYRTHLDGIG